MSVLGFFVLQVQLGTVCFPGICLGGSPVTRCSLPVLGAVTESGGGGPFMLAGRFHVGLG